MDRTIAHAPLAEKLRPKCWKGVVGQKHLLGHAKPLRLAFESGIPHSMIFWGPPGVGKTTLARLTAQAFDCEWLALSAVLAGVKEVRAAVGEAEKHLSNNRKTLLFIDEIHRFNKSQQDALLPFTESGLLTFVGATTENPSFEVNNALLSRAQVYCLKALESTELQLLLERGLHFLNPKWALEADAIHAMIAFADGDARRLYNGLEHLFYANIDSNTVSVAQLNQVLAGTPRRFDKGGEYFYDQISALHKSVRGSAPDAALYWLTRMLDGGVDPKYLSRRIIRMAWEDIGLADPRAMQVANDAAFTYERLGSPEGELALAQAVIYLSVAAKSNAGYCAYNKAREWVKRDKSREVPLHLRNAPTALMKKEGYAKTYRYAHDEPHGYAAGETYFPEGMPAAQWYQPVSRGLEIKIRDKLSYLASLDAKAESNK